MQQVFKTLDELPAMLTVMDIKVLFGIGKAQAYELVHSEDFPAMKVGGSIKVPKHRLLDWIDQNIEKGVREC